MSRLNSCPLAVNFKLRELLASFLVFCFCSNPFSILVYWLRVSVVPNLALARNLRTRESGSMGTRNQEVCLLSVGKDVSCVIQCVFFRSLTTRVPVV